MKNLLLLSGLLAASALADVKMYASRAAWLAAVASPTTIDFGPAVRVDPGTYRVYPAPLGLTLAGVNFSSNPSGGIVTVTSQTFCCATYRRGFDQLVSNYTGTGIAVTLPAGTEAVGFDLFSVVSGNYDGTNQDSVDITFAGQKYIIKTPKAPGSVFVGFLSTTPVSSFTIMPEQLNGATEANLMNFAFSSGPLPSVSVVSTINPKSVVLAAASLVTLQASGVTFDPGSVAVDLVDSAGLQANLTLLSASASRIDAVLPDGLASGLAVFSVTPAAGAIRLTANASVASIAPGVLVANTTVSTTHADGSVTTAPAYACWSGGTNCVPLPLNGGLVTLYGSGIRGMSSLGGVSVSVGGVPAVVVSAGPQGDYSWMDQVSFLLPDGLQGAGLVSVVLSVDGVVANEVALRIN